MTGKVWFVGAGPGDVELLTLKGCRLLQQAGAILYAGSLVNKALLDFAPAECELADSSSMHLQAMHAWLLEKVQRHAVVVRLQTGDPSLYGALIELIRPLDEAGVKVGVIPGISSAMAAAACAVESLTLPEVTQSVIFTRLAGRTKVPPQEDLKELASHHCTLCLFLSIEQIATLKDIFVAAGWSAEAPILVVYKASQPEQIIIRGTLTDIAARCQAAQIHSQAMIIISPTLGARYWPDLTSSRLYAAEFSHRFRPQTVEHSEVMAKTTPVTEQLTVEGQQIEHSSFAIIDQEAGEHAYTAAQWPIVRRIIHSSADFSFNGLTRFHAHAIVQGVAAIRAAKPIIADVSMIKAGTSARRLRHFGINLHCFIHDTDVAAQAKTEQTSLSTQAMRKAHQQGLLEGAIVAIGNAPTALQELMRLIHTDGIQPALIIGMPVGFVGAAEAKAALAELDHPPWILTQGRKGGSTLVIATLHALLALAASSSCAESLREN